MKYLIFNGLALLWTISPAALAQNFHTEVSLPVIVNSTTVSQPLPIQAFNLPGATLLDTTFSWNGVFTADKLCVENLTNSMMDVNVVWKVYLLFRVMTPLGSREVIRNELPLVVANHEVPAFDGSADGIGPSTRCIEDIAVQFPFSFSQGQDANGNDVILGNLEDAKRYFGNRFNALFTGPGFLPLEVEMSVAVDHINAMDPSSALVNTEVQMPQIVVNSQARYRY